MKLEEKIAKYHLEDLIDFKQLKIAAKPFLYATLVIAMALLIELILSTFSFYFF
ncbi:hypothetical protein SCLARK_00408 [Spiroplasma clarkii]|uniref:hypothetical protein n=1 Tax=Spiroplasma clarkii TaxID=2139 RepID=UPI000B55CFE4|nr:hypothetical protein [Spiroplasma clarkii]ARU91130.1 hypothetical protein SCLARK_00408 [Spiroplasma clarkii]